MAKYPGDDPDYVPQHIPTGVRGAWTEGTDYKYYAECPNCSNKTLRGIRKNHASGAEPEDGTFVPPAVIVCDSCYAEFDPSEVDIDNSVSPKLSDYTGQALMALGIIVSLTGIGLIVGIPLFVIGALLRVNAKQTEADRKPREEALNG